MIYHCGKFDEDRVPSTCDFKTDNGVDMLDHIHHGHSIYYCHSCIFKSRNRDEIEDHSHYEDLLDDIFKCNICGGPLESESQICGKCQRFHAETSFGREIVFLKCDLCDFKTQNESEFNEHQEHESQRLFKLCKEMNQSKEMKSCSNVQRTNKEYDSPKLVANEESIIEDNVADASIEDISDDETQDLNIKSYNFLNNKNKIQNNFSYNIAFEAKTNSGGAQNKSCFTFDYPDDHIELTCDDKQIKTDKMVNLSDNSKSIKKYENIEISGVLKQIEYRERYIDNKDFIESMEHIKCPFNENIVAPLDKYKYDFGSDPGKSDKNKMNNVKEDKEKCKMNGIHAQDEESISSSKFINKKTDFLFKDDQEISINQSDICNTSIKNSTTLERHENLAQKIKWHFCEFCVYKSISEFNMWSHNKILHEKDQIDEFLSDIFYEQNVEPAIIELLHEYNINSDEIIIEHKNKIEYIEYDDSLLTTIYGNGEMIINNEEIKFNAYSTENFNASIKKEIEELKLSEEESKKFVTVSEIPNSFNEGKNNTIVTLSEITNVLNEEQNNTTINQCKITLHSKQNLRMYPQIMYVCEQCQENSETNFKLKNHYTLHATSFPCDKCDSLFNSKGHLINQNNILQKGYKHSCNKCESVFNSQQCLIRHTNSLHKDTKSLGKQCGIKFECKYCSQFMFQCELKHDRKTYMCYQCNSIFTSREILKQHIQFIHGKKSKDKYRKLYEGENKLKMEEIKIYFNIIIQYISEARKRYNRRKKIKALGRKRKRKKKLE